MEIKSVKVTKASLSTYWYFNHIGTFFNVIDFNDTDYEIIQEGMHDSEPYSKYIKKTDCDVLDTYYGLILKKVDISIRRT